MITIYELQISFLLSEAIFCLLAGVLMGFNQSATKKERHFVMLFNFASSLLLVNDFMAYMFRGTDSMASFVMVRVSNGMVFLLSDLIVLLFGMFLNYQIFGTFGLRGETPCKYRNQISYTSLLLGLVLIFISQFTGWYYTFDAQNYYHRGNLFWLSTVIVTIPFLIDASILIQYHKRVSAMRRASLALVIVLPTVAMVVQILFYGASLINISIGLSFIVLYIESNLNLNQKVMENAETEVRTGLANEHGAIHFFDAMDTDKKTEYACVYFDVNNFGQVNRKFGMEIGNRVLMEYGKKLDASLAEDEILARQGSDKFVAILKKTRVPLFLNLLQGTSVTAVGDAPEYKSYPVMLSAIAGVYEVEDEKANGDWIISHAVEALSYAKNVTHKDVEYMTDEVKHRIVESQDLEEDILVGLRNNEFLVYYQPKVNSRTLTLCGAEALVRWLHNDEMISPGKFIPALEKGDHMCDLDYYMLRHVCADLEHWITKGLVPPTVSVNFSRRNLANPNAAEQINDIINSYHVPKKMIEIEITETIDEFPISVMKEFIDALHRYGICVAVDDFGCGSSSLSLLREVTFDTLKIDKGFVDRAYAKDLTILNYIIKLAKAINLEVLAEGVEHKEQVETLLSLGCEVIQGYYFDKPLPKDIFEKRVKTRVYEMHD